jgi:uracil-DNA glycosylase family 4
MSANDIYNHSCDLCPLANAGNNWICLPGRGSLSSRALVVGEAPGGTEDREGKPFVGRSGEILTFALETALLDLALESEKPEPPYITNSVKCRPPDNRTPTEEEALACFTYLEKEVEALNPVAVMTLGNAALYSVTGEKGGVTTKAGIWKKVSHPRGDPLLVMPNLHPAYILRNPSKHEFFAEVVKEFVAVWQYGLTHRWEDTWEYATP